MPLDTVTYYRVVCDAPPKTPHCLQRLIPEYHDLDAALKAVKAAGWELVAGRVFCPNCKRAARRLLRGRKT